MFSSGAESCGVESMGAGEVVASSAACDNPVSESVSGPVELGSRAAIQLTEPAGVDAGVEAGGNDKPAGADVPNDVAASTVPITVDGSIEPVVGDEVASGVAPAAVDSPGVDVDGKVGDDAHLSDPCVASETCAGDGECDPCVDGVDGDDGAGGPADSGAGGDAGKTDGAGSQVPRVLPVPASVRALRAALAGGEWDGMFSSYRESRAAIKRNWKRLRGGVAPEPVNRPVSEEVLSRALADARDMQSGRLAPTVLAAAEAETDGVDAYAEHLRERAAADIASKGLDDGSTSVPSLSMAVPKLTEADKRSGDWSIRDGQLSDPRCKTMDGMAAAIQYGMDATGGLCYCGKRVAWRVVVDRATGEMGWRCASKPASGDECQHDHVFPASLGGFVYEGNLLPACADCNARKSNMSVWDFIYVVVNDHALDGKRRFDDAASFAVFILEAALPFLALLSEREWETLVMGVRPVSRVETWLEQQAMMGVDAATLVGDKRLAKLDATEKTYADPMDVSRGDFDVICTMMRAGEFSSNAYSDGEVLPPAGRSDSSKTATTLPVSVFCSLLPDAGAGVSVGEGLPLRVASAAARGDAQFSGDWDGSKWSLLGNVLKRYVALLAKYHGRGAASAGSATDSDGSSSVEVEASAGEDDELDMVSEACENAADVLDFFFGPGSRGDDGEGTGRPHERSAVRESGRGDADGWTGEAGDEQSDEDAGGQSDAGLNRRDVLEAMSVVASIVDEPDAVAPGDDGCLAGWRSEGSLGLLLFLLHALQEIDSNCRGKDKYGKPSKRAILEGLRRMIMRFGGDAIDGVVDCWGLSVELCSALVGVGSISLSRADWVAVRRTGDVKSNAMKNADKRADCMAFGFGQWLGDRLRVDGPQGEKTRRDEETTVPSTTDRSPVDALRAYVKTQLVLGDSPLWREHIAVSGGAVALGRIVETVGTPSCRPTDLVKGGLLGLMEARACRQHGDVDHHGDLRWFCSDYSLLEDQSTPSDEVEEIQGRLIRLMDETLAVNDLVDPLTGRKWSAGGMDSRTQSKLYERNRLFNEGVEKLLGVPADSPIRCVVEHVLAIRDGEATASVPAGIRKKAFEDRELPDGVTVDEALAAWEEKGVDLRGRLVSSAVEARHAVRGSLPGKGVAAFDEHRGSLARDRDRWSYCSSDTLAKMVVGATELMDVGLSSLDADASEERVSDFVDALWSRSGDKSNNKKCLEWYFSWMSSADGYRNATPAAVSHGQLCGVDMSQYVNELDAESRLKIKKLAALAEEAYVEKTSNKSIEPLFDLLLDRLFHKADCGQRGPVAFTLEDFVDLAVACRRGTGQKDKDKWSARKNYDRLAAVVEMAGDGGVGLLAVECAAPSFDEAISMAD